MKKAQNGFSLIELAIVLVIVTLLVGGLAVPLSAQIEARRIAETRKAMQAIHDTLIGYAMSHTVTVTVGGVSTTRHYLPCPDTDNDGREELRTSGDCPADRGGLPWITLGVQGDDAWGNRFTYAVSATFSNSAGFKTTPPPATQANLNIYPNSPCTAAKIMENVPAVWVSHGPQGRGALNMNGGTPLAPASVAADERQNLNVASGSLPCTNVTDFVSHPPTVDFDDLVLWLSSNELFSRVCPSAGCP